MTEQEREEWMHDEKWWRTERIIERYVVPLIQIITMLVLMWVVVQVYKGT